MDVTIHPSTLAGQVRAVASKSVAHRMLILSALADGPSNLRCSTSSEDIVATIRCLTALGARITRTNAGFVVEPVDKSRPMASPVELDCGESGSTLRFLIPVVAALGMEARFVRRGRLAERPLSPLDEQLEAHGITLADEDGTLAMRGTLCGGKFVLPGNVSSQFVSGLLMAGSLFRVPLEVFVSAPVQSRPYIVLTIEALEQYGVTVACDKIGLGEESFERFALAPGPIRTTGAMNVEGDWSNAAFWLAAGALEHEGVTVTDLSLRSSQGDRAILAALAAFGARIARRGTAARATQDRPRAATIDVAAIPDLVPPLAAVAATAPGTTTLLNAGRLRLKESDRLATVSDAINALGGSAAVDGDTLCITGTEQLGAGTVDAAGDHRIAMLAAIMATHAAGPVRVLGADCVAKSYPGFWDDYASLGGIVERDDATADGQAPDEQADAHESEA